MCLQAQCWVPGDRGDPPDAISTSWSLRSGGVCVSYGVVTDDQRPSGLNQQTLLLLQLWRLECEIGVWAGPAPLEAPGRSLRSLPALGVPVFLGLWLHPSRLCLWGPTASSLCLCVSLSPRLLIRTLVLGWRAQPGAPGGRASVGGCGRLEAEPGGLDILGRGWVWGWSWD